MACWISVLRRTSLRILQYQDISSSRSWPIASRPTFCVFNGRRLFLDNRVHTGSQERPQRGQRALLCREEQLLLTFSDEGSRQLKLIWASLTLQEPECIDPTFSRSRIQLKHLARLLILATSIA